MEIQSTKANFTDERGEIRDILTHEDIDAVTYITFAKGAVRGNHYHEETIQWDYVLSGVIECYSRQGIEGPIEMKVLTAGDLVKHPIGECHALRALEPASMLSLSKGPRKGFDYEKDVIRLKEKMIS